MFRLVAPGLAEAGDLALAPGEPLRCFAVEAGPLRPNTAAVVPLCGFRAAARSMCWAAGDTAGIDGLGAVPPGGCLAVSLDPRAPRACLKRMKDQPTLACRTSYGRT